MGVFTRTGSPVYWLYLETTKTKVRTDIRVGTTAAQRADSRRLASDLYHQTMNQLAARQYKLPTALPAIRFDAYAERYTTTIALHRGHEREREILGTLTAFFRADALSDIDPDRVRAYMAHRVKSVTARTVNREVGLLKSMLRDAVPKYLAASPLVGMAYLRTTKPRRRLMTHDEERRLLEHADPIERALLLLGIDGLVRLGDILDLTPNARRGAWLEIADPKGGDAYEVALSPRACDALDAITVPGKPYFLRYRGSSSDRDRRGAVRKALQRLCTKVNVPYGRKVGGITFHWATRKTGATRLIVEHGAPVPAVQRQGNWKTADVLLSIYAEADRAAQQRAIDHAHPRPLGTDREQRKAKDGET